MVKEEKNRKPLLYNWIMNKKLILIVDDEKEIREMLVSALSREGYETADCATAEEAADFLNGRTPDLILLDIMLPGIDGYSLLRKIRRESDMPVIFMSAKAEAEDRYEGFEAGGDDYLIKPFFLRELMLRVKAVLRRANPGENRILELKNGVVDLDRAEAKVTASDGQERVSHLTAREFEILMALYAHRGKILSVNQLSNAIGGENWVGYESTLMSHIRHLREKIETDPGKPENIITIRGLGYRLE